MQLLNFLGTTQEGDQQRFKRESQDPLDNIADCMWPTIQGLGVLHDSFCDSVPVLCPLIISLSMFASAATKNYFLSLFLLKIKLKC